MARHSAGKGDRYRKVDQAKYDANWAKAFPPKPKAKPKKGVKPKKK